MPLTAPRLECAEPGCNQAAATLRSRLRDARVGVTWSAETSSSVQPRHHDSELDELSRTPWSAFRSLEDLHL